MIPFSRLFLSCAALAFLGAGGLARAETILRVDNQTGRTLVITQPWSIWRPEPDDPPMSYPVFRRWLSPGAVGTYRFQYPGKDLESSIVIRDLPLDGTVDFERLTIQALDRDGSSVGEEL
jgi:hypothetical protein